MVASTVCASGGPVARSRGVGAGAAGSGGLLPISGTIGCRWSLQLSRGGTGEWGGGRAGGAAAPSPGRRSDSGPVTGSPTKSGEWSGGAPDKRGATGKARKPHPLLQRRCVSQGNQDWERPGG
ncbi:hypothetical protein NDU88_002025 [Pleurodeles waltl]|uniref:Uncharacterized protein n=1 Tax=Pleurodeles waltl TaxID=8319 RepID=A0AAV7T199_PLEWA|nr:hypothetical protein NDU88_002025 [Pleurodeles waltl]